VVVVALGQDALLQLVVCADPRPRRAIWEWGSQKLEAGDDLGRYKAEELTQASGDTCFCLVQAFPQDSSATCTSVRLSRQRQVTLPIDTCFPQDKREDCYEARLHVREVDHEDSRSYYLAVENERGTDRHAIHLAVKGK
jgi:hypothetical protein